MTVDTYERQLLVTSVTDADALSSTLNSYNTILLFALGSLYHAVHNVYAQQSSADSNVRRLLDELENGLSQHVGSGVTTGGSDKST